MMAPFHLSTFIFQLRRARKGTKTMRLFVAPLIAVLIAAGAGPGAVHVQQHNVGHGVFVQHVVIVIFVLAGAVAAGVPPRRVWPQSFNYRDILYWKTHAPAFADQLVMLEGRGNFDTADPAAVAALVAQVVDRQRKRIRVIPDDAGRAVGLDAVADAIGAFFAYMPNLVAAFLVLVLGMIVSQFLGRTVATSACRPNQYPLPSSASSGPQPPARHDAGVAATGTHV